MQTSFEPLHSISIYYLTLNVVFLIGITTARLMSELATLPIRQDLCIFHPDRGILHLDLAFVRKVNSIFHRTQELVLPDFCPNPTYQLERKWHYLDVRRELHVYIKQTAAFRSSEALFVKFQPGGKKGSKTSSSDFGHWARAAISRAYSACSTIYYCAFHLQCGHLSCLVVPTVIGGNLP